MIFRLTPLSIFFPSFPFFRFHVISLIVSPVRRRFMRCLRIFHNGFPGLANCKEISLYRRARRYYCLYKPGFPQFQLVLPQAVLKTQLKVWKTPMES